MSTQTDSRHYVERPNHVSSADYLEALQGVTNLEAQRVAALRKTSEKVERINSEYERRITALFGADRHEHYRAQLRDRTAKIWAVADAHSRDNEGRNQVRAMRDAMRAEVRKLQSTFGLDEAKLRSMHEARIPELDALMILPEAPAGGTPHLVTGNSVPLEIRTGRTNPWQAITPPYSGWSWAWSWSRRGGMDPIMSGHLNSDLGDVGSSIRVWDSDVGDNDFMHCDYRNAVGVYFTMPATGLVEAWVELQNLSSYHQVIHEDEWGWSGGYARVGSHVTMQVASPSVGAEVGVATFEVNRGGTDFSDWGWGYPLGSTYWAHLFSPEIHPAGQTLYVLFGSYEYLNESVDDVEYNDQVTYRWFIRRLWLRSSGK
jgi:hypothetical protein